MVMEGGLLRGLEFRGRIICINSVLEMLSFVVLAIVSYGSPFLHHPSIPFSVFQFLPSLVANFLHGRRAVSNRWHSYDISLFSFFFLFCTFMVHGYDRKIDGYHTASDTL